MLLVRIKQYDSARMQLREGAFKSLRMDLGYGVELTRLVSQKVRACGGRGRSPCVHLPLASEQAAAAACWQRRSPLVSARPGSAQCTEALSLIPGMMLIEQDVREVVEGVERLDGALKRKEAPEALEPAIAKLGEQIAAIGAAVARMEEVS